MVDSSIQPNFPHRRYNPLTGEYVFVSPNRTERPWQGKQENVQKKDSPSYEPKCYRCPGNERAGGKINSEYETTFVFTNDFAALLPDTPFTSGNSDPLFQSETINGTSKVICFSPKHNLTLPRMDVKNIRNVIDVWSDQVEELGKTYKWVQVF